MDVSKIGRFIAQLRREKDLTQRELAQKLGVSDRAVSKWERGLNLPDASLFEPLCGILDISVTELLRGEREMPTLPEMEKIVRDTVALAQEKENKTQRFKRLAAFLLFLAIYLGSVPFLATHGPDRIFQTVRDWIDPPVETLCIPPRVTLYFRDSDYEGKTGYGTDILKYVYLDVGGCYYLEDSAGNFKQAAPVISQPFDSAAVQNCYTASGSEPNNIYFLVEGGYGCDDLKVDVIRYPADRIGGIDLEDGWPTKFRMQDVYVPGNGDDWEDWKEFYYIDFYPQEHYFAVVLTWGDGYYAEYPFFTTRMEE